jgi:hypothetical protein
MHVYPWALIQNWVPEDRLIPPAYYPMPITRGRYEMEVEELDRQNSSHTYLQ